MEAEYGTLMEDTERRGGGGDRNSEKVETTKKRGLK